MEDPRDTLIFDAYCATCDNYPKEVALPSYDPGDPAILVNAWTGAPTGKWADGSPGAPTYVDTDELIDAFCPTCGGPIEWL